MIIQSESENTIQKSAFEFKKHNASDFDFERKRVTYYFQNYTI